MGYALPIEEPEGSLVKGTVAGVGTDDGAMLVRTPRGMVRAERAAGCLLKPRCGDTVLTAFLPDGEAWVTCVLARAEAETEAELALPERTALRARELSIEAEKAGVAARHISMEGTILSLGGGLLLQGFAAVQTAARRVGERIARKEGRYGELSERTEGLDERSAGRMRVKSETSSLHNVGCKLRSISSTSTTDPFLSDRKATEKNASARCSRFSSGAPCRAKGSSASRMTCSMNVTKRSEEPAALDSASTR